MTNRRLTFLAVMSVFIVGACGLLASFTYAELKELRREVRALREEVQLFEFRSRKLKKRYAYLIETGRFLGEVVGMDVEDGLVVRLPGLDPSQDRTYKRSLIYIREEEE
jgi:hypothetical protein